MVYDAVFGRFSGLELLADVFLPLPGIPTSRSMNSCAAGCGSALLLLVADDDDEKTELLVVVVVVLHVFLIGDAQYCETVWLSRLPNLPRIVLCSVADAIDGGNVESI